MEQQTENHEYLQGLVEQYKLEIFSLSEKKCKINGISLSPKLYAHPLSHGQLLTINYEVSGKACEKAIYLKFRKNYVQLPDKYMAVYNQVSDEEQFLPKFYFFSKTLIPNETVIGMEYIQGISLRSMLYSKMFLSQTRTLKNLFYQNGRKMRMFHDVQQPKGSKTIQELVDSLRTRMQTTPYFTAGDIKKIKQHLDTIEKKIDTSLSFDLINIHHDWSLRNIIVEAGQRIKLIDLDAFNRSIDWRWNDFVYFLINIESQVKYWPALRRKHIGYLWESFYQGYFEAGECESVNPNLMHCLIYLIKLDYWTDTYSLDDFYNFGLGKRYVKQLKKALAAGRYSILSNVSIR